MRVPCGEGLASHAVPELCVAVREGRGEALTGERAGQPLSDENTNRGVDAVIRAEDYTDRRGIASAGATLRRQRPWHAWTSLVREPGDLRYRPSQPCGGPHREGEIPKPMMHDAEKSDLPIVARKRANKAARAAAEPVERRGGTEEKAGVCSMVRTRSRAAVSQVQARLREAIRRNPKEKLTALLHHVTPDTLRAAFLDLKKDAAPGIDGVTWDQYAPDLEPRLADLHARVHRGAYRAQPSRRRMIPKPDGRERPLGIAALEDKIVQGAVVALLTPVYEAEFLGFSYGFRPGRGQHDALDALAVGIERRRIHWILDADIRAFFDSIDHDWLMRFVEHRIADKRILRLIQKWLKAGVLEDGWVEATPAGVPQGATISPLLANVYLHYVYDLWVQHWRRHQARGDMIVVRYADDTIVGFEHEADAERFLADLRERLATFSLSLHPAKTRLIAFGRWAGDERAQRGEGKPDTFDFLGFTHICGKTRYGRRFQLRRKTQRQRLRAKLKEVKNVLRRNWRATIDQQGRWLTTVIRGHMAYFAVPTNSPALAAFCHHLGRIWYRYLRRRSQRCRITWDRMKGYVARYFPPVRVKHPWPSLRFDAKHPR